MNIRISWVSICVVATLATIGAVMSVPTAKASEVGVQRAGSAVIEEIVVRTRRREESAQDVPVSIVAFSGEGMEQRQFVNLSDFSTSIPNVEIGTSGLFPHHLSVHMRGIAFVNAESFTDPPFALYVDEIYRSRNAEGGFELFDIESIEVMRGPQGTLYGRNAFSGAIAVRSQRPVLNEQETKLKVVAGGPGGRVDTSVALNLPLVEDVLASRLVFGYHRLAGNFKNHGIIDAAGTVDPNKEGNRLGDQNNFYARPSLRFTPSPDLDITLIGEWWRVRNNGPAVINGYYEPGGTPEEGPSGRPSLAALAGFPGKDPFGDSRFGIKGDGSNPWRVGQDLIGSRVNQNTWGLTLNADYSLEAGTITLVAGMRDNTSELFTATSGENADLFTSIRFDSFKMSQGELRFVSTPGYFGRFDFVTGLFGLRDEYQTDQILLTPFNGRQSAALIDALGVPRDQCGAAFNLPVPDCVGPQHGIDNKLMSYGVNGQDRYAWAVYTQVDYRLTDQLSLVGGIRYSWEEKKNIFNLPINSLTINNPGRTLDEINNFREFDPSLLLTVDSKKWDSWAPRLGVDYRVSDDVLLFAFWQRAHKSGGFSNAATTARVMETPIGQESVDTYEIGIKSEWLDRRVRLNANAFFSEYSDLQRQIVRDAPTSTGQESLVQNAADAEIYGIEVELSVVPIERLLLTASVGWLNAEYKSFCADLDGTNIVPESQTSREVCGPIVETVPGAFLVPVDNSVLDLQYAPKWDAQLTGTYDIPAGRYGTVTLWGALNYTSSLITNVQNIPRSDRRALTSIDASLTWASADHRYRVSLWGKNLTDNVERGFRGPVGPIMAFEVPTPKRQYGLTLHVDL